MSLPRGTLLVSVTFLPVISEWGASGDPQGPSSGSSGRSQSTFCQPRLWSLLLAQTIAASKKTGFPSMCFPFNNHLTRSAFLSVTFNRLMQIRKRPKFFICCLKFAGRACGSSLHTPTQTYAGSISSFQSKERERQRERKEAKNKRLGNGKHRSFYEVSRSVFHSV